MIRIVRVLVGSFLLLATVVILFLAIVVITSAGFGFSRAMGSTQITFIENYTGIAIIFILLGYSITLLTKIYGDRFLHIGVILLIGFLPTLFWFIPKGAPFWFYLIPTALSVLWLWIYKHEKAERKAEQGAAANP